jgi:type 1 fimbria pilin
LKFNHPFMENTMISLSQLKKMRSTIAALSTLIALQSLYAQSADAQVTFTSTISALTCTISINSANGAATANLAIGNTSVASGGNGVAQFTRLTAPTAFTVSFKGSGGIGLVAVTDPCGYPGKLNVAFGKGASNTEVSIGGGTRALQRLTTDTIGVGIEIESVNGSTITPIKDYTTPPTYSASSTRDSSQHGLPSVSASTGVLNFQAYVVKYFATTTPITSGSVSVAIPLNIAYN